MTTNPLPSTSAAHLWALHPSARTWTLGEDLLIYTRAAAGGGTACEAQVKQCLSRLPRVRSAGVAGPAVLDAPGVFSDLGPGRTPFEARPGGLALLHHCRRHPRDPLADGCGLVLLCDGEPIGQGETHEHTRAAQRAVGEHGWWLNIVDGPGIRWDRNAALHIVVASAIREGERLQRAALVRRRWRR